MASILSANTAGVASIGASGSSNMYEDVGVYTAGYDPAKAWVGYVYADRFSTSGSLTPDPGWGPTGTGPANHPTTADKLDALSAADINNRLILTTNDASNTSVLFKWVATPSATSMSAAQLALLGQDRINYLRGDRTKELPAGAFRKRESRQGDIVNSGVWYVGVPASNYSLPNYKTFRQTQATRTPMIYVGGNDGMLHGFSAQDGSEKIAYVPKGVIGNLSQLSDPAYGHLYYVDNTPFTGDVYSASQWYTMLVGTLGAGGRGYFVLDVTNSSGFTASSAVLDRTLSNADTPAAGTDDADIGNIFAAPVMHNTNPFMTTQITRMNNDRWAVILGNGYNSVNERPVLLIQYLDGTKGLKKIPATGSVAPLSTVNTTANGLSAPRVVDINGDGRADVVYAGDLKGNMWKFDLTSPSEGDWNVAFGGAPLYTALDGAGPAAKRQPITAVPTVKPNDRTNSYGVVGGMMVAFATGRNVTEDDRSNSDQQTLYSVLDNTRYKPRNAPNEDKLMVHSGLGPCPSATCIPAPAVVGSGVAMLQNQTVGASSTGADHRTYWNLSNSNLDWDTKKGWYLKLPVTRERGLKTMSFYDSSNILSVFTEVPDTGTAADGDSYTTSLGRLEACSGSVTRGKQYWTLINIMDGKPPSISIMDRNGDGYYTTLDGGVSRVEIPPGPTRSVSGQKTIDTMLGCDPSAATCAPDPDPVTLERIIRTRTLPETPIRPSWYQRQ